MNGKNILAGLVGFAVGAAGSFFITKSYYKKKYKDEAEATIDHFVAEMDDDEVVDNPDFNEDNDKPEPVEVVKQEEKAVEMAKNASELFGYIPNDGSDFVDSDPDDDEEERMNKKNRHVEFISDDELDGDATDFPIIRYTWYPKEQILHNDESGDDLAWDKDDLIDEVGIDFREAINKPSVMAIYIRDYTFEYDYAIEKAPLPYKS